MPPRPYPFAMIMDESGKAAGSPEIELRIAALETERGPLPADFDAAGYVRLHPDLKALFTHPREGALHYLECGRHEGRVYPSNLTRAQEKVLQARRIALIVDGLDASGKTTIAHGVATAIGGTVVTPFHGSIGGLMVHLAVTGQHDLSDSVAHAAVAAAVRQVPEGPVVFDRHWFTASQLLSSDYRPGWEPRPFSVMCWADRPTTLARMAARGDADAGALMSEARVTAYRTFAADLDMSLLDTSYLSPEEGIARVLAMMPALPG